MKLLKSLFNILIVALCLASCSKEIIETTGNIVGTVKDARTNEALSGASVLIVETGATTSTGTDGSFMFRNIEALKYTLKVTKANYKSDSKNVLVNPGKDNTVDFSLTPSTATLSLSQKTLDFGENTTNLTFDIKNTGTAALTWSISEDIKWLSCTPTSGTVQPGESSSVVVNVDRTGMEGGTYTQTIAIASNGGSEVVKATMIVASSTAALSLSQKTLDFGETTTNLTFDIKNTGTAALTWSISEDIKWLTCTPTSGIVQPGKSNSVVVNVNRTGLERGNYTQTIAIASNGGSEVVRATMTVGSTINVSISPSELDFGTTTTTLPLTITNNGNGNVSYTISKSNEWIKVNKESGTFSTKENINVSVDRSGFSAGDYSGSLTFKFDNEDKIISVKMSIPSKEIPVVTLYSVEDETYNSAKFKGGVVSVGSSKVTKHGFCWSKESVPNLDNSQVSNLGDCTQAKEMVYNATSLDASTTYYVRAYAENAEGVGYSNILKFQTSGMPDKSTVETGAVSDITDTGARVSGNIVSLGNVSEVTQHGHVWSEKPNPTISNQKTELGKKISTGAFNSSLTKLTPNTKYYVRAYATNSIGTAYGAEVSFTTKYGDMTLVTESAKDVTYKSAVIPCKITSLGGHSIAECGVCWGETKTPTIANNVAKATTISTSYEISLGNLAVDTKYYVRAYAKAQDGTIFYGNEISFTTSGKDVNFDKDGYEGDENWNSQDKGSFNKTGYDEKDNNWNK